MHIYQKIGVSIATFIWGMMGVWCIQSYQQWLLSSNSYQLETQLEELTDVAINPGDQLNSNIKNNIQSNMEPLQYGYLRSNSFTPIECLFCNYHIIFYQFRDGRQVRFEESRYNGQLKQKAKQYLHSATIIEKSNYLATNTSETQKITKITRIVFTTTNSEGNKLFLIAYDNGLDLQLITAPTLQLALEFEQAYQRIIADNFK